MLLRQDDLAGFELRDEGGITRWRRRPQVGSPKTPSSVLSSPVPGPVDPGAGRSYAFTGDTLYVLADGDPDTWTRTPIAPTRSTPFHGGMVWLDAVRNRMLCFGPQGELWILALGASPSWSLAQPSCVVCARSLVPMALDGARDRLLLTGGSRVLGDTLEVWSLELSTLAWTRLLPGGVAPVDRYGHSETYDPVNDRLVLAGGRDDQRFYDDEIWGIQFAPGDPVGHFERFDLGAQPLATALAPPTVDLPGLGGFVQALDTQRDLVRLGPSAGHVTVAASSPQPWNRGATTPFFFSVTNLADDATGVSWRIESERTWPGFPVTGSTTVSGKSTKPVTAFFPVPDTAAFGGNPLRVVVAEILAPLSRDSTDVLLVDPDASGTPLITGPGDWIWKPGAPDTMPARLVNRADAPKTIVVSWTVDRDWPGFADSLAIALQPGEALDLGIPLAVPDSAAAGTATLTLRARRVDRPEAVSAASVHLHDIATPTRISLVEAAPSADGGVDLTWWTPRGGGVDATVQRRVDHGAWETLGSAISDASGRIEWRDAGAVGGERYAYRAGMAGDGDVDWSDETWVDVPGRALAFLRTSFAPLRGVLLVDVRLGTDAVARVDAFDVRGRRVASRSFNSPTPGIRLVDLGPAAPGIYFLRLTQDGRSVRGRALVLSTR
jgi:hypothetical protein